MRCVCGECVWSIGYTRFLQDDAVAVGGNDNESSRMKGLRTQLTRAETDLAQYKLVNV